MRAVIYARYSTDQQSASSVHDQQRLCRVRADALGVPVVATHADEAVSGATSVAARPGGRELLAGALARRYDVLIVESLDRLSRDQVDLESVVRRLEHRGIRIIGISDGYDTLAGRSRKLVRGIRGMIAEAYLEDLAEKTHRGLTGQVARGYVAGGVSFGYRTVSAGVDSRGESVGSRFEIVKEHAAIVREIFARYAAGESVQRIAADLNMRRVASPRGSTWCVSALYGSPAKGSGVLNNELYVGRYIWNRSKWVKDPDTHRRQRIDRPRAEWVVEERPELRIVDDETWAAVRTRMDTPRAEDGRRGGGRPATTLFGGTLRCSLCGGAVIAINARDYGCGNAQARGPAVCTGLRVRRAEVDAALVEHLRAVALDPASIDRIASLAVRMARDGAKERERSEQQDQQRAVALDAEIGRLTDAIAKVGFSEALAARLRQAEAQRAELAATPSEPSTPPYPLHAKRAAREMVERLCEVLREDSNEARPALRAAFGPIVLRPVGEDMMAEFEDAAERLALAVGGAKVNRVAGARFGSCIRAGLARPVRRRSAS